MFRPKNVFHISMDDAAENDINIKLLEVAFNFQLCLKFY